MGHGEWKDMFKAVQINDIELVSFYLHQGIDVNYQHPEYMTSALIESIRCNHLDMLEFLLKNGAAADMVEVESGKTPLAIAQQLGNKEAERILERHL